MIRRLFFGGALVFAAVSAVGAAAAVVSDEALGNWVIVAALTGATLFFLAVMLTLRESMRILWKVAKVQNEDLSQAAAMQKSLRVLRKDSDAGMTALMREFVLLNNRVSELAKVQATALSKQAKMSEQVAREAAERAKASSEIEAMLKGVGASQDAEHRRSSERWQKTRSSLSDIAAEQRDKTRSALRAIANEQDAAYRQLEAMISMTDALDMAAPLPPMRATWAMSPDSAAFLVRLILERRPRHVLELGSGVSTALVARALQLVGGGEFRSLEQDPVFLEQTATMLRGHGLEADVELIEAAITDVQIEGQSWSWYSPAGLVGLQEVDLVIVDGPPSRTGPLARYPALPMTADLLNDGALVFLDDADREDERAVVERWLEEFPVAALDVPKLEKGAALLAWSPPPPESGVGRGG